MEATGPSETLGHQTKLIGTLSALFNKEHLSDIQLMVNQKLTLNAHKFILAVHSDVFKALLDTKRWSDAKGRAVQLTEDEDCLPYFKDFLRYLYSGSLTLSTNNVLPLHVLSEKYNVQQLRESCQRFMLANVATPGSWNRAITWQRYARLTGLGQLEEECLRFIAWNIGTVIQSPDWTSMEDNQLSALLQRSDLVVEDEMVLFRAVVTWLSLFPERAGEILAHLRYPLMAPEKLFELQAPGSLPEEIRSYLLRESLLVYQLHLLPTKDVGQRHDITTIPFTMRFYTSGSFSHPWDITGYKAMGKTTLSKSMSTKLYHLKTEWCVTFCPKGQRNYTYGYNGYQHVSQDDDFSTLSVSLRGCHPTDQNHSHKLSVLLYRCLNGEWFVCEAKTLEVPHSGSAEIKDLIPLSERDKYISDDTMKLHLIGQTIWEKC